MGESSRIGVGDPHSPHEILSVAKDLRRAFVQQTHARRLHFWGITGNRERSHRQ